MYHIYIRSFKINLWSFELCLANLNLDLLTIDVSETWLRDNNCDLYNLDGYRFKDVLMSYRTGGVWKYI